MSSSPKVGFVGAGNMANALVRGLAKAAQGDGSSIAVTDIDRDRCRELADAHGVQVCDDAPALAAWADVVVLAVKPQVVGVVLQELAPHLSAKHLLISIAAGVTTEQLAQPLEAGVRIVRAMPNTPALVSAGATAVCVGPRGTTADLDLAERLFSSVGRVVRVDEGDINAIAGLSGSGPAYIFVAIEALADAGVREGLPRPVALELAAQTVRGAAKLVLETGEHPAALKDKVASPGGTTIAALAALEKGGLRSALHDAVHAAVQRAKAMDRGQ